MPASSKRCIPLFILHIAIVATNESQGNCSWKAKLLVLGEDVTSDGINRLTKEELLYLGFVATALLRHRAKDLIKNLTAPLLPELSKPLEP